GAAPPFVPPPGGRVPAASPLPAPPPGPPPFPPAEPLPPNAARAATVAAVVHAAPSLDTFTSYPAPPAVEPSVTSTCFTGCTEPRSTCSHAGVPAASALHSVAASSSTANPAFAPELAV